MTRISADRRHYPRRPTRPLTQVHELGEVAAAILPVWSHRRQRIREESRAWVGQNLMEETTPAAVGR